ncbi:HNH endonuclease signature motif containing protein [Phyllobacterium sp. 22229]|uniref:HNH endonuclease signature motif containing protein n=1 Tax=Phyllobacterium sp. 22229 TaxID=3453895 RepID=UPI003F86ABE5
MKKQDISERLFAKTDKFHSPQSWNGTKCHEWNGFVAKSGYGQIHNRGKACYVHRVSYEIANGPIPQGLQVLHHCDNRICVNPDHLFVGTLQENMDDMVSKLRQAHGPYCFHAKLTVKEVHEIRASRQRQRVLAERFGVSCSSISMIRAHKIWRYV